jgi:hypothetical protein
MADEPTRESQREQRRADRAEAVRANAPTRVRVLPANDQLRKILKHPASGGFQAEGSTEWPLDQFTKRRLRDGDITIEETPEGRRAESREPAPKEAQAVKPTNEPPRR